MIDYEALEDMDDNTSNNRPIRRNNSPVNEHHDWQKRVEHKRNRERRQLRQDKSRIQDA